MTVKMRVWKCRDCCKSFQTYGNLLQHRQTHSLVRPIRCQHVGCYKTFATLLEYQTHYRWHINKRLYCCGSCGKRFLQKSHQILHRCPSIGIARYQCYMCRQIFKEKLSLAHHLKKKHPQSKRKRYFTSIKRQTNLNKDGKEDNKILLKITAGKSMTIISPTKKTSQEKSRKNKSKKAKRKHKDEERKNGIVLSIKKGQVNMSSTKCSIKNKTPKQESVSTVNGMVNRVIEPCSKGGNLKMRIKTLSDKSVSPYSDKFTINSYPSSPITTKRTSKKETASCSSDTEIKSSSKSRTSVSDTSRVRNGIVIVKDKTGNLLAEQLQSSKAKKRDNVFDCFSDVGMWKVMPSPRPESTLDALKLRFSPQKPARLDSGVDSPYDKSKYLDIGMLKSQKLGNYSEDSDVFEASPGTDKDLHNVNDSGIEILSSSSCNRSNGNSVHSVILDENSPTYFPTEDSLLSIDSPANEMQLRLSEHTVCAKCGGIIMETNNNAQSPRKCHCNTSLVNSPTQTVSPIKSGSMCVPYVPDRDFLPLEEVTLNSLSVDKDNSNNEVEPPDGDTNVVNLIDSDSDDSDIVMIDVSNESKTDTLSEFEDVEIIRDKSDSDNKSQNNLKLRLKLKPKKAPSAEKETKLPKSDVKNDTEKCEKGQNTSTVSAQHISINSEKNYEKAGSTEKVDVQDFTYKNHLSGSFESHICPEKEIDAYISEPNISKDVLPSTASKSNSHVDASNTGIKKKPLFKAKKSSKVHESENKVEDVKATPDSDTKGNTAEIVENNCVRKKKPIFKKRSISEDSGLGLKKEPDTLKTKVDTTLDLRMETDTLTKVDTTLDLRMETDILTKVDTTLDLQKENDSLSKVDNTLNLKKRNDSLAKVDNTLNLKNSFAKVTTLDSNKESDTIAKLDTTSSNKVPEQSPTEKDLLKEINDQKDNSKKETGNEINASKENTNESEMEESEKLSLTNPQTEESISCISDHKAKTATDDETNALIEGTNESKVEDSEKLSVSIPQREESITHKSDKTADSTVPSCKATVSLCPPVDEDSLPTLPPLHVEVKENKNHSESVATKKSCTSPLDLFQQQFLSFLSSNKPSVKDEKSKAKTNKRIENTSKQAETKGKRDDFVSKDKSKKEEKGESKPSKEKGDSKLTKEHSVSKGKHSNKALASPPIAQSKDKLSLRKTRTKQKPVQNAEKNKASSETDLDNPIKGSCSETDFDSDFLGLNVEMTDNETVGTKKEHKDNFLEDGLGKQKDKIIKNMTHTESRSDSLSWLKIFSDSIENNKNSAKKDEKSPSEEIVDFSADLAAINKKMDVSDDELNALDVDDVFKSTNLSILQPRVDGERSGKRQKPQIGRPQKAKRSIGKFKQAAKISDSESEQSDSSSNSGTIDLYTNVDPDFNPYHDSDGDFDIQPTQPFSKERRTKRPKSKKIFLDFESDSDIETTESCSQLNVNKSVSRSKRVKQGQKSCCPCCLGSSPSKDHHQDHHHKYKLPKNSKQFVKSSIKLRELQAKIHQLFLSLFPDCAELISNSKIGTEEFEILIEEVLGILESKEINFEGGSAKSGQGCAGTLYSCPSDSCNSLCNLPNCDGKKLNLESSDLTSTENCESMGNYLATENKCEIKGTNDLDKQSSSNHQTDHTLIDDSSINDTQILKSSGQDLPSVSANNKCHINPDNSSYSAATSVQLPQASSTNSDNPPLYDQQWNSASGEHAPRQHPSDCGAFEPVESDITITIDLNAAKVSLCRDPKHCLERLHNRIPRLVQCLLPKLKLKKTFFKSINNLSFLLDLMITSNLPGSNMNISSDEEEEMDTKTYKLSKYSDVGKNTHTGQVNIITKDSSSVDRIFSGVGGEESAISGERQQEKDSHTSPVDRVPLLSKFQDMFEQEIKLHRESLKKDVFELDTISEKGHQNSLFKAKQVLTTISKFEELTNAKQQKARPRRDPRLRKRSEAETRKLFVQEKIIQNNQHSSIVCHSSPKKLNSSPVKSRHKRRVSQNSKESFLSKLNLGGNKKLVKTTEDEDLDENSESVKNTESEESESKVEESDLAKSPDTAAIENPDDKCTTASSLKTTETVEPIEGKENNDSNSPENIDSNKPEVSSETVEALASTVPEENSSVFEEAKETSGELEKEETVSETKNDVLDTAETTAEPKNDQDEKSEIPETEESALVHDDSDAKQKSGEKNIFELMQPS